MKNKLESIKEEVNNCGMYIPFSSVLSNDDVIWLIGLAEKTERYEKALFDIQETYIHGQPNHLGEVMVEVEDTCDTMYQFAVNATTLFEED